MKYIGIHDMKNYTIISPTQNTKPLSWVLKPLIFFLISLLIYSTHNYKRGSFSMRWSLGVHGHYSLWLSHSACQNQVIDTSLCVSYRHFKLVKQLLKFSTRNPWYLWVASVSVDVGARVTMGVKLCRYSRAVCTVGHHVSSLSLLSHILVPTSSSLLIIYNTI